MNALEVGKKLVDLCKQGKNEEAIEALYSPDVVSVEAGAPPGQSPETKGIAGKGVHWVRPELVAQVGFTEWTPDGKLRHPRYLGLRNDKAPETVVREGA